MKKYYVFVVCGDKYANEINITLKFFKQFTKQNIIIVYTRTTIPIHHNHLIKVDVPEEFNNKQAGIFLKTGLFKFLGDLDGLYCYMDTNVIPLNENCDSIFEQKVGIITFAPDISTNVTHFSEVALKQGNLCDVILNKFNIVISDRGWTHWNGGVFLFDKNSVAFLEYWHRITLQIFDDFNWNIRDQGTLIATTWKFGLQNQVMLEQKYNYIVSPSPFYANKISNYSLYPEKNKITPYFLHFVDDSFADINFNLWQDVLFVLSLK